MTNRWMLAAAFLAVMLLASSCNRGAGSNRPESGGSKPTQLTVGIAAMGTPGTNAPQLGVALGMGAFALEGLDVKWVSLPQTTNLLIAALQSDHVQIESSGLSPFFVAAQKDISITYFFSVLKFGQSSSLFARNGLKATVKTPKDLAGVKGLRCGSGSPGTTTYASLQLFQKVYGFKCEAVVNSEGAAGTIGALEAGSIDVAGQGYLVAQLAAQKGSAYMLVDPTDETTYKQLFGTQQLSSTGYLATASYVKANPAVIQKFVNALLLAEMFMRTHTADQVAAMILRSPGVTETRDQIKTAVASLNAFMTATPGYMSQQDWNANLTFNAQFLGMDTSGPALAYGTFWNAQFVEKSPFFVPAGGGS